MKPQTVVRHVATRRRIHLATRLASIFTMLLVFSFGTGVTWANPIVRSAAGSKVSLRFSRGVHVGINPVALAVDRRRHLLFVANEDPGYFGSSVPYHFSAQASLSIISIISGETLRTFWLPPGLHFDPRSVLERDELCVDEQMGRLYAAIVQLDARGFPTPRLLIVDTVKRHFVGVLPYSAPVAVVERPPRLYVTVPDTHVSRTAVLDATNGQRLQIIDAALFPSLDSGSADDASGPRRLYLATGHDGNPYQPCIGANRIVVLDSANGRTLRTFPIHSGDPACDGWSNEIAGLAADDSAHRIIVTWWAISGREDVNPIQIYDSDHGTLVRGELSGGPLLGVDPENHRAVTVGLRGISRGTGPTSIVTFDTRTGRVIGVAEPEWGSASSRAWLAMDSQRHCAYVATQRVLSLGDDYTPMGSHAVLYTVDTRTGRIVSYVPLGSGMLELALDAGAHRLAVMTSGARMVGLFDIQGA